MSIYDGKIELPPTPTTTLPKHYSPTREEILKALGAISEIEYNKMWRSLDEKTKDINELVQKIHILEKKLEIATKALEYYANCKPTEWMSCVTADKALKEMEGVK